MSHSRLLDLSRLRREHERALGTLRPIGMADAMWVRLAARLAESSAYPLAVAGRYDRAAIMAAAHAFARVRREAGAREPWRVLMSQGLRGAWIAARRALPVSVALAAVEEADQRADLGDDPTPATLDLHSPEHDTEMSAWFEAEFTEPAAIKWPTLPLDLPEHVPRAA